MLQRILGSLAWLTTAPVIAQTAANPKGSTLTTGVGVGDVVQMLLGLAVVLGIIFAMAWVIRRMGHVPIRMQGFMKVLGGVSIGQRERVVLIQVGDQQLLIGVAPGQIRTLHVLTTPVTGEDSVLPLSGKSFAEKLQAMLKSKP
ncbi:MAG: flagellar biosynthetic protein FliO [Gammaproteobacteria bacterium]|nr:flagellar biosynthetic protein FliO [Gammaproteobacteria bacterium]